MRELRQTFCEVGEGYSLNEFDVMQHIAESGEQGIPLRSLTDAVLITQSSVSRLVHRLETRGLVVKHTASDDARAVTVTLTAEGRTLFEHLSDHYDRCVEARLSQALDANEVETLRILCERLRIKSTSCPEDLRTRPI